MSTMEKSDSAIRAGKPANKGGRPTAERAEQRAGTEENPGGRNACRTQSRESVDHAIERIRQAVDPTVCRQTSEVGAECVNAHAWIRAGGAGQPVSLPQSKIRR